MFESTPSKMHETYTHANTRIRSLSFQTSQTHVNNTENICSFIQLAESVKRSDNDSGMVRSIQIGCSMRAK